MHRDQRRITTSIRLSPDNRERLAQISAVLNSSQTKTIEMLIANARIGMVRIEAYPLLNVQPTDE